MVDITAFPAQAPAYKIVNALDPPTTRLSSTGTATSTPSSDGLGLVRHEVRQVLENCDNWHTMPPGKRREMANNMVRISKYLASDPNWLHTEIPEKHTDLAQALGPVDDLKKNV